MAIVQIPPILHEYKLQGYHKWVGTCDVVLAGGIKSTGYGIEIASREDAAFCGWIVAGFLPYFWTFQALTSVDIVPIYGYVKSVI